jgi:cytochrome c oxidase subunit 3
VSIFSQLTAKPWLPAQGRVDNLYQGSGSAPQAARIGLKMFLAVASVLFMLLIMAYAGRMAFEDWRPAPESRLLWLNTFVLILSSLAMQWAQFSARRGLLADVKIGLLAGGITALAFLVGQMLAWRQLAAMGLFDVTNPAIAFFYLITGLHALHLLGGLIAWGRTADKVWRLGFEAAEVRQSVELCTLYWHFLLAVWLVLFGLLFSGSNNMAFILAICGIT